MAASLQLFRTSHLPATTNEDGDTIVRNTEFEEENVPRAAGNLVETYHSQTPTICRSDQDGEERLLHYRPRRSSRNFCALHDIRTGYHESEVQDVVEESKPVKGR